MGDVVLDFENDGGDVFVAMSFSLCFLIGVMVCDTFSFFVLVGLSSSFFALF